MKGKEMLDGSVRDKFGDVSLFILADLQDFVRDKLVDRYQGSFFARMFPTWCIRRIYDLADLDHLEKHIVKDLTIINHLLLLLMQKKNPLATMDDVKKCILTPQDALDIIESKMAAI